MNGSNLEENEARQDNGENDREKNRCTFLWHANALTSTPTLTDHGWIRESIKCSYDIVLFFAITLTLRKRTNDWLFSLLRSVVNSIWLLVSIGDPSVKLSKRHLSLICRVHSPHTHAIRSDTLEVLATDRSSADGREKVRVRMRTFSFSPRRDRSMCQFTVSFVGK